MTRRDHQATSPRGARWIAPVAIVGVMILLIAGILGVRQLQDDGTEGTVSPSPGEATTAAESLAAPSEVALPDLSGQEAREGEDLLAEGPVDAPVVMVVFSDYQCSFCASWSQETLPELREYVEAGDLRIEYRDVNVYGEDSVRAARASLAAGMQGRFTEYHDALFEGGKVRSASELSEESLVALAGELGMDTEQFAKDMSSPEVASRIEENAQQGISLGATTTPSFIIDGEPMAGAQPTEVFTEKIDTALETAEG